MAGVGCHPLLQRAYRRATVRILSLTAAIRHASIVAIMETSATLTATIASLEARVIELRRQIACHPWSQELAILADAVDRLRRIPDSAQDVAHRPTIFNSPEPDQASIPLSAPIPNTILGAAEALVERAHEPLGTRALLTMLPQHGVRVGGKDPARNLSSIISKRSKRLRSVGKRENARWWLIGRPLPAELLREAAE